MLDRTSSKPLYSQMEDLIRENLTTRKWAPGSPIASENELSREYGISRVTVRNVITKLVQQGLLFRIPGKGTYVTENKIVAKSLSYAGIREQLEQMGYKVSTKLLSANRKKGSKEMCDRFGIAQNSSFYVIKRLRYVEGEPFSVHTSYIPAVLCDGLDKLDLVREQLCTVLSKEYGLIRSRTQETLESVPASKEISALLGISEGHPLLLLQDTIMDEAGNPFEYANVIFRGEKIRLTLEF
jgi:GntR family transcriptional regulator